MAFKHYLEEENDKPYFTTNSLGYYYDKMEGFAEKVEQAAKTLNVTKEEVEKNITAYIEQNKNELDQRLVQWDEKLETFDSSVETLLTEWVDDGTLSHVIDSSLIDQRIAPVTAQLAATDDKISKKAKKVWVDVTELGAILDGTDNTTIMQQAVDSISTGGGTVYIPEGTLTLTNTIAMKSGVHIKGAGMYLTTVKGNVAGKPYFKLETGTDTTIKNVTFSDFGINTSGNTVPTTYVGMIHSEDKCNIENLKFERLNIHCFNNYESGIFTLNLIGTMQNVRMEGCTIICEGDDAYGILLQKKSKYVWILDNRVDINHPLANNNIGLYADCENFTVRGNRCMKGGHSPIAISPGRYGIIDGNHIENVPMASEAGIEVEWKGSHGGTGESHHIIISNNIVKNCYYGVIVTDRDNNGPGLMHNISIIGNIIETTAQEAISLSHCKNVNVKDNLIEKSGYMGVFVKSSCGNGFDISGNTVNGATTGLYIQATGTNYKMLGNTVTGTTNSGITLETGGTGGVAISNNVVRIANTGGHGISVKTNNNLLIGNVVERAVGNPINDIGTGNIVANNILL